MQLGCLLTAGRRMAGPLNQVLLAVIVHTSPKDLAPKARLHGVKGRVCLTLYRHRKALFSTPCEVCMYFKGVYVYLSIVCNCTMWLRRKSRTSCALDSLNECYV